jgi:hypothetical protein
MMTRLTAASTTSIAARTLGMSVALAPAHRKQVLPCELKSFIHFDVVTVDIEIFTT